MAALAAPANSPERLPRLQCLSRRIIIFVYDAFLSLHGIEWHSTVDNSMLEMLLRLTGGYVTGAFEVSATSFPAGREQSSCTWQLDSIPSLFRPSPNCLFSTSLCVLLAPRILQHVWPAVSPPIGSFFLAVALSPVPPHSCQGTIIKHCDSQLHSRVKGVVFGTSWSGRKVRASAVLLVTMA